MCSICASIETSIIVRQGEVIFPKNNPISCAEGGPSAPSFSDGASPLPARVASDTGNVLGRGPQVPQEQYAIMAAKGHFNRHDPIIFNLKDSNALGIPIMDALEGEAYRLMGAKDAIINLDKTSTSLRILVCFIDYRMLHLLM